MDSVPSGEPLSDSELSMLADDYMVHEFGEQAVGNKFDQTICQEKKQRYKDSYDIRLHFF